MSYLPFLRQLHSDSGKHISFPALPPAANICGCILHDDVAFISSIGAKKISNPNDRFAIFTLERDNQHIVFFETGMGTAQTSVIFYEMAAHILPNTPLIKLGTCGLLDPDTPLGSVIVPSFAVAAEGVSGWNTVDCTDISLENHIKNSNCFSGSEELIAQLSKHLPSSLEILNDSGVITTDALYALYNQPNILSSLKDYRWNEKKVLGIEMEVSSFFSSASVCAIPAAAFIVGSWSLDQQLRFARGQNPQRTEGEKKSIHANERILLKAIIEALFIAKSFSIASSDKIINSPAYTLNNCPPPQFTEHKYFSDAQIIHQEVQIPLRNHWTNLPVLAEGYAFIESGTAASQPDSLFALAGNGKTIVCSPCTEEDATVLLNLTLELSGEHADGCLLISCGDKINVIGPDAAQNVDGSTLANTTIFLVFDSYLLRRYLHIEAQRKNELLAEYLKSTLPVQEIEFIGLGPARHYLDDATVSILSEAEHVVLFDRTLFNIVSDVRFKGNLHIINYSYNDFSKNLLQINNTLTSLHAKGIVNVKVLIEGNPEIYDFAEGLSMSHRKFCYREALPLIYMSCRWIENAFALNILNPSYVLLSGFNARHGVITEDLLNTINDFLDTKVTFMIMEMFCGDIPLVMKKLSQCKTPKSVFVLTNMFSPEQKIWFVPTEKLHKGDWVNNVKGRFTTLVVVDNERLLNSQANYREVLRDFEAPDEYQPIKILRNQNMGPFLLTAG